MIDVNFNIRDGKYLQVSLSNKFGRHRINLGAVPEGLRYVKEKNQFVGQSMMTREWNVKLLKIQQAVVEHFDDENLPQVIKLAADIERKTDDTLLSHLEEYVRDYESGNIHSHVVPGEATIRGMVSMFRNYNAYCRRHGTLGMPASIQDQQKHLTKWMNWLTKQGFKRTTQGVYVQKMRQALKYMEDYKGIKTWQKISVRSANKEVVPLPPDLVEEFLTSNLSFENPLRQGVYLLSKVMLIGCMAISDAVALSESLPKKYIEQVRQKTNTSKGRPNYHKFYLPDALIKELEINKRVRGYILPPEYRSLRPARQNEKFNKHLTKIFAMFEKAHQLVEVGEQRPNGHLEKREAPLLEFITSHIFRKSGATYYFNKGVPLEEIRVIGAWSPGSKIPGVHYIKVEIDKSRSIMDSLFE